MRPSRAQALPPGVPESYALATENDRFQLYVDSTTLAFKLLDRRSGYLWHSGLDAPLEGDRLNRSWQAFAQSGISIEHLDERGVNRRVSITNSETTVVVTPIERGIRAEVTFEEYGLTFSVLLQLEATGLRVEVPFDSIRERGALTEPAPTATPSPTPAPTPETARPVEPEPLFRLGRIYVYPFLGAVRGGSVEGYLLLPDGTGSLIRFAESTRATTMFVGRYYGLDLGMIGTQPFDPLIADPVPLSYPVYGLVHGEGQNAFLSVVEDGAAYGELQAHPAGVITNFNFIHHAFIYNESYFQATNRSGAGVTTVQREPNAFNAVVHYRFLTGPEADYVGLAHSYQQYLVEHGQLSRADFSNPNIGIRLEFLGGDKERVLFWNRFIPMTTIQQMSAMLADLQLPNVEAIYYGWQPGGASAQAPTSLTLEGGLGDLNQLHDLAGRIAEGGGHFSLYLDPQMAIEDEPGYSARNDLAMAITDVNVRGFHRNFGSYFSLEALRQRFTAFTGSLGGQSEVGLALDSIGWLVYSDFRDGLIRNRQAALNAYRDLLAAPDLRLAFYRPNDYLLGVAQAYYDMPLGDNGYIYTSEAVPFLPIVLGGYLPYYGPVLNFSADRQADLLRQVEYGLYPAYILTQEATANMLNTPSSLIYTSSYAQWGEDVVRTYQWMNDLLSPVRGQPITGHRQLAVGVFATTYADGKQIVVNYSQSPFALGDTTIPAHDAVLLELGL